MFRRHLGLHPHETDALPWWLFRMYSEEMVEEFRKRDPDDDEDFDGEIVETDDISVLGISSGQTAAAKAHREKPRVISPNELQ